MSDIKHMEVSTCQAAYNTLMNQHAELTAALQSITTSVTSMVGTAWIGTSATEFSARYDQLRLSMNQQLDQLLQLTNARKAIKNGKLQTAVLAQLEFNQSFNKLTRLPDEWFMP